MINEEKLQALQNEASEYATYQVNDVYYTSESEKKAYIAGATAQALKNESNAVLIEALDDIDFKLIILEDHLHGEDGNTVTAIRGQLATIIKLMQK